MCTNRGVSFPKLLDNLFIKKWIHDVDIYVFLVTRADKELMPTIQVNYFMTCFISPSATVNENKIEGDRNFWSQERGLKIYLRLNTVGKCNMSHTWDEPSQIQSLPSHHFSRHVHLSMHRHRIHRHMDLIKLWFGFLDNLIKWEREN